MHLLVMSFLLMFARNSDVAASNMNNTSTQILQQNRILLGGQTINLRARQMIYALAAMMDKENPTGEILISAREFLDFINNTSGEKWTDIYSLTSDIFDHLNKNPILIKEPRKKDFIKINWLGSLGVVQGNIRARFSTEIAEYFLYKQGLPYTKLLWDLRPYKSNFTARLLDLFQKYHIKDSGIMEFDFDYDIEELKLFFGVHEKYERFFDFEKRVLEVTRMELEGNDMVPYWFSYEKLKQGRNISAIRFTVYVRPQVLLDLVPDLKVLGSGDSRQSTIFDAQREMTFSDNQKKLFSKLVDDCGLNRAYAQRVLSLLTESQAFGYYYLIQYGVNRTLAYTILREHCSFGELEGHEHQYIRYALEALEAARKKRIAEAEKGGAAKRVTPDDKRGGLAKKVFTDRQYFSAFMEQLSANRKSAAGNQTRNRDTSSIGHILKHPSPTPPEKP